MPLKPVTDTVSLFNKKVNNLSNTITPLTENLSNSINTLTSNVGEVAGEAFNSLNIISDTLRNVNKNLTNIASTELSNFLSNAVKDNIAKDVYKGALSTFNTVTNAIQDTTSFIADGLADNIEIFNVGRSIFGQLNNVRKTFSREINQALGGIENLFDTDFRNIGSIGNKVLRNAGIEIGRNLKTIDEIKRELDTINISRFRRDINRSLISDIKEPLDDIRIGISDVRNNRNNLLNKLRGNVDNDIFYEIKRQLDSIVDTAESIDQYELGRQVATFEQYVNDNVDGRLSQELTDRIIVNGYDPYLRNIRRDENTIDLLDDYRNTNANLNEIRNLSDFLTEEWGCDLGGERITDDILKASNYGAGQNFYNNLVRYFIENGLYRHLDCILRGGSRKHNNRSLHSVLTKAANEVEDSAILRVIFGNNNVVFNKNNLALRLLT